MVTIGEFTKITFINFPKTVHNSKAVKLSHLHKLNYATIMTSIRALQYEKV